MCGSHYCLLSVGAVQVGHIVGRDEVEGGAKLCGHVAVHGDLNVQLLTHIHKPCVVWVTTMQPVHEEELCVCEQP